MALWHTHEEEREIEVCQTGPSEQQLNRIIEEFKLENDLPEEVLTRSPDPEEEHSRMNGSEKRAVQPTPTLGDELGNLNAMVRRLFPTRAQINRLTVVGTSVEALAL